jgi:hypothetical protein
MAQEILGERFGGCLVTDRWSAYTWYHPWQQQLCWAHLRRDIAAMIKPGWRSAERGEELQTQVRRRLHGWVLRRCIILATTPLRTLYWRRDSAR